MRKIINYYIQFSYQIFLSDAIGAFVSILFLILIYLFERFFGVPKNDILVLITVPSLLVVYSSLCYFLKPKNWPLFLKIVATTNLGYCIFTLYLVFKKISLFTFFGVLYFFIEIVVILFLVSIELKVANHKNE